MTLQTIEKLDVTDILKQAAEALAEEDRLLLAIRVNKEVLRYLCRQFDKAERTTGIQPHHLRTACNSRGIPVGGPHE